MAVMITPWGRRGWGRKGAGYFITASYGRKTHCAFAIEQLAFLSKGWPARGRLGHRHWFYPVGRMS